MQWIFYFTVISLLLDVFLAEDVEHCSEGVWSAWHGWTACVFNTTGPGDSHQFRARSCLIKPDCTVPKKPTCSGTKIEMRDCTPNETNPPEEELSSSPTSDILTSTTHPPNPPPCNLEGVWSEWREWSDCPEAPEGPVPEGNFRFRERICEKMPLGCELVVDAPTCIGNLSQEEPCSQTSITEPVGSITEDPTGTKEAVSKVTEVLEGGSTTPETDVTGLAVTESQEESTPGDITEEPITDSPQSSPENSFNEDQSTPVSLTKPPTVLCGEEGLWSEWGDWSNCPEGSDGPGPEGNYRLRERKCQYMPPGCDVVGDEPKIQLRGADSEQDPCGKPATTTESPLQTTSEVPPDTVDPETEEPPETTEEAETPSITNGPAESVTESSVTENPPIEASSSGGIVVPCLPEGKWSEWGEWTGCPDAPEGPGPEGNYKFRERTCNPMPAGCISSGGHPVCGGNNTQSEPCSLPEVPTTRESDPPELEITTISDVPIVTDGPTTAVTTPACLPNGEWSEWNEWTECPEMAEGPGPEGNYRLRERKCQALPPGCTLMEEPKCEGVDSQQEPCDAATEEPTTTQTLTTTTMVEVPETTTATPTVPTTTVTIITCLHKGEWGEWTEWTECPETPGPGAEGNQRLRERKCRGLPPGCLVVEEPTCEGPDSDQERCVSLTSEAPSTSTTTNLPTTTTTTLPQTTTIPVVPCEPLGVWTAWGGWTDCPEAPSGPGPEGNYRLRERQCQKVPERCISTEEPQCEGSDNEQEPCDTPTTTTKAVTTTVSPSDCYHSFTSLDAVLELAGLVRVVALRQNLWNVWKNAESADLSGDD
ncbi:hypothetical protein QR680_004703 [Steinernema hermaphroditum]|uniref:G-protein coupled receptors family 2 profile 1 domain-containing protein n=1 Tax=Steinernema hermaphroditum TaxID=289476 RepID=A0AA39HRS7_9BILA|nr:hypothetical protein QR680_004703 [Steinernema hermaphroditum]